jgi:hypothetical protein
MVDLVNIIGQNGIAVVCVAYMIYFQNTTMKEMLKSLKSIDKRLSDLERGDENVKSIKNRKSSNNM